jgi:hypothetical protein
VRKFDAFYQEAHKGVVLVRQHMDDCYAQIQTLPEREQTNDRDLYIKSSYLRARGWILSLSKLNHPSDIQALACGCSSLMECAVDTVLLANDPTNQSGERMRWWDLSARYQMAIAVMQADYRGQGKKWAKAFISRNESFVTQLRKNLWPQCKDRHGKPRHPRRWTGSTDIQPDIRAADGTKFKRIVRDNLNETLLRYYGSEYQYLNKTIHGSGKLGVEGSPQFISVRATHACWAGASLAMICHQVLCTDRDLDSRFSDEWLRILKIRKTGFVYFMRDIREDEWG